MQDQHPLIVDPLMVSQVTGKERQSDHKQQNVIICGGYDLCVRDDHPSDHEKQDQGEHEKRQIIGYVFRQTPPTYLPRFIPQNVMSQQEYGHTQQQYVEQVSQN